MENKWQQLGTIIKKSLLSQNKSLEIDAILDLKTYLEEFHNDIGFVQVILKLDIHEFLLNILTTVNHPVILDVLKCLEYLCSYKIYFNHNQAVPTAETILKSIYFLIKNNECNDLLKNSIQLLTDILTRLNHYSTVTPVSLFNMLKTIHDILNMKNNGKIICAATLMFGAFLTYEALIDHINEPILVDIEQVWIKCIASLSQLYHSEKKEAFVAICVICENALSFSKKILAFESQNNEILKCTSIILDISVKCLNIVCIPFMATSYDDIDHVHTEYLGFLEILLKTELPTEELSKICQELVQEKNFNIIAKYINFCDSESTECIKQFCLIIIVKIIVYLTPIDIISWPHSEEEFRKNLLMGLQVVPNNVEKWLSLLENDQVNLDSKWSIILFSSIYYVHSNNVQEMRSSHLCHLVTFLYRIPYSMCLPEILVKELWLLFAMFYSSFHDETKIYGIGKAIHVLERLILNYIVSLENILTFHTSILYWLCVAPGLKPQLKLQVFEIWLLKINDNEECRSSLWSAISKCKNASNILFHIVKTGLPKYALPATEVLRLAFQQGYLNQNQNIIDSICSYISFTIIEISSKVMVRERVINAIYMLQLGTYVDDIHNVEYIQYFVKTFTNFMGTVGLTEKYPSIFYVKAFQYTNSIMCIAKQHGHKHVFSTFLNSGKTVHVFLRALMSGNQSLSIESSKIIIKLLQFQVRFKNQSTNYLTFDKEAILMLLGSSDENQLIYNLQIVKNIFRLLPKHRVLSIRQRIDKKFMRCLYLRCTCLISNPGLQNIIANTFDCLLKLLNYIQQDKSSAHNYLWDHPANFTLIYLYCDRDISRPFLCFLRCWLLCIVEKVTSINKLSINYILWVTSVNRIANLIKVNAANSEHSELIHDIAKQLLLFSDILPLDNTELFTLLLNNLQVKERNYLIRPM